MPDDPLEDMPDSMRDLLTRFRSLFRFRLPEYGKPVMNSHRIDVNVIISGKAEVVHRLDGGSPPLKEILSEVQKLLIQSEKRLMSQIGDQIKADLADLKSAATDEIARLSSMQTSVDDLNKQIADLKAQLGDPAITPEEAAEIHAEVADLTAQLKAAGFTPTPPVEPPVEPTP